MPTIIKGRLETTFQKLGRLNRVRWSTKEWYAASWAMGPYQARQPMLIPLKVMMINDGVLDMTLRKERLIFRISIPCLKSSEDNRCHSCDAACEMGQRHRGKYVAAFDEYGLTVDEFKEYLPEKQ